jgi:hypothetical protein
VRKWPAKSSAQWPARTGNTEHVLNLLWDSQASPNSKFGTPPPVCAATLGYFRNTSNPSKRPKRTRACRCCSVFRTFLTNQPVPIQRFQIGDRFTVCILHQQRQVVSVQGIHYSQCQCTHTGVQTGDCLRAIPEAVKPGRPHVVELLHTSIQYGAT